MLLLKSIRRHQDRSMMRPRRVLTYVHFHSAHGFSHPNTRIDVRLLGPCFKTGRLQPLRQHPSRSAVLGRGRRYCVAGYNTLRKEPRSGNLSPTTPTDAGLCVVECTKERLWMISDAQVWLQALPFQQFHVLFNSLSKVLFIFRSLYLCAIGLWPIFSFR